MFRARLLLPAAAAIAATVAGTGSASAQTYCVYQGLMACAVGMADGGTNLQAAINTAAATPAADTIVVLEGTYAAPAGGFQVTGPSPLTIDGTGDATMLVGGAQTKTIELHGHTLSNVRIGAPTGAGAIALAADGASQIHDVSITGNAPILRGMVLRGPVTVDASTISVAGQSTVGIDAGIANGLTPTVSGTEIAAPTAYFASGGGSTTPFLVHRLRTSGGGNDVVSQGAHVQVDHGVFQHVSGGPTSLIAQCGGGNAILDVDHVTAVSTSTAADTAVESTCQASGLSATVVVANSVLRGFERLKARTADSGGTATVVLDHSDITSGLFAGANTGPGEFLVGADSIFAADPGFLSDTDWHLAAGSPLIDAGNPGSSPFSGDMDELPRTVGARQDIGAYEFQGAPAAPAGPGPGGGGGGGGGGGSGPAKTTADSGAPVTQEGPAAAVPVTPADAVPAPAPGHPVTVAQLRRALRAAIATGAHGVHTLSWPTAGRVRFAWVWHGKVVARGTATRSTPGRARIRVTRTRALPRHARVSVRATFTPTGRRATSVRAGLTR